MLCVQGSCVKNREQNSKSIDSWNEFHVCFKFCVYFPSHLQRKFPTIVAGYVNLIQLSFYFSCSDQVFNLWKCLKYEFISHSNNAWLDQLFHAFSFQMLVPFHKTDKCSLFIWRIKFPLMTLKKKWHVIRIDTHIS